MKIIKLFLISLLVVFFAQCSTNHDNNKKGSLIFTANGEDFVRKGFTSRDKWHISFDHLYVNIAEPTAYFPGNSGLTARLDGSFLVDLAKGGPEAEPVLVGELAKVKLGNYQSLKFTVKRITSGEFSGSSIIMTGKASRKNRTLPFTIRLNEETVFDGKDGYVGDHIKGIVTPGKRSNVEMTFHFDHIFGDITAPADSHVNTESVGFDYFARFVNKGIIDVSQENLEKDSNYKKLVNSIRTLGHLGEGHCEASSLTSM